MSYLSRPSVVAALLLGGVACTAEPTPDADPDAGAVTADAGPADAGTQVPDAGSSDAGPPNEGPADAGTPATKGISVTVGGTTRSLTMNPAARKSGNSYVLEALRLDGAQLTRVNIQLEASGASAGFVEPPTGDYTCSGTLPSRPYLWGRIQYSGPEGTYQFGDGTCVHLSSFGAVGEAITGTFSVTLANVGGSGAATLDVTGSFDLTRID